MNKLEQIIAKARADFPDLHTGGFGQRVDEAFNHRQIETAMKFLRMCKPTKSQARVSSYWLKHCAERWGCTVDLAPYVANGALIVAAHALGLLIKRYPPSPNAGIGIDARDLDRKMERERKKLLRQGARTS